MSVFNQTVLILFGLIGTFFFGYSVGRQSAMNDVSKTFNELADALKQASKKDNGRFDV